MRILKSVMAVLVVVAAALAQKTETGNLPEYNQVPSFDVTAMDKSVDPCVDFYQFACGTWRKNNPIPSDQPIWGRFNELQERNRAELRDILEKVSANDPKRNAIDQKIGDYYASCMDEKTIEAKAATPLQPELDRIVAIKDKASLTDEIARLHGQGIRAVFRFGPTQDLHNSSQMIADLDQGGLGLPDRDYYIKDDPKSGEIRKQYAEHVQKMFELLGDKPETAAVEAKQVMAIETDLANASMDRTLRRDPKNSDNKMSRQDLRNAAPGIDFPRYFSAAASPQFKDLNVSNPEFFKQLSARIDSTPLADWKTYLRWHLVHDLAVVLSSNFVNENFRFFGQIMTGQKELQTRWKRCTRYTDTDLGEALGERFVERTFGAEGKARTLKMVNALEKALEKDITDLPWMTATTKQQALIKLHRIANKIGYPDKWRDYSSLKIIRGDAVGNSLRSNAFEVHRQLSKIGKPMDKMEWFMSPPTVNAYYSGTRNEIVFPAGILQPPFYNKQGDDAVNFGGIGAVIGHELTHGFDDEGSKFDPDGNLRNWWTPTDEAEFKKRTDCIADEYSGFTAVDDVKLKGRLTLGENTADNGGVRIALIALQDTLGGTEAAPIQGYTADQRLFLGFGQIWCQNETDQIARLRAVTDPHSPGRYRTNGVVSNMPEFQKAFNCKAGSPMVRPNACRVW